MDEFKMMDDSPALYYAQAAWALLSTEIKAGKQLGGQREQSLFGGAQPAPFAVPPSPTIVWISNAAAPAWVGDA
jgi:hypothetical protein